MKRLYLIIVFSILAVVSLNIFFFFKFKSNIIEYQKSLVSEQVGLCGSYIEKTISKYENDLTRILFRNIQQIPEIFTNPRVFRSVSLDLQGLYAKNRSLITNVSVFDNKDSYLGMYLKDNDELVIDTFPRQNYNDLQTKDIIIKKNAYYISYFPFFKDNELTGNVVVEINLEKYLNSIFSLFKIQGLQYQWVANSSNQVMMCNFPDSVLFGDLEKISEAIDNEEEFVLEHSYIDSTGNEKLIISAVYPLNVLNNDLGIVFTIEAGQLNTVFLRKNFLLIMFSLFVMIFLLVLLIYHISKESIRQDKRSSDLLSLKMIVEHFPVGIMIIDSLGTIKNINRTGQKMLFLEKDDDITGSKLSSHFLVSNKYLLKDGIAAPFDSSHFIHYEKDGNEIIIYRKDIKAQIAGEELTISALIDVTPLEKSRKQDVAANMAKSDFLARMSLEVKTPMNGITGMTDNLLRGKLSQEQKEQVIIIKKSSDLLLNLINDILDFSKIEAGKMLLEEIPFSLSEELGFTMAIFNSLANEKGLEIQINIHPGVPDHLIGDPLRIRQVMSNLINNAIKFTHEGRIVISVNQMERINSSLSLIFSVEDTGVGIPKENLKLIFGSYELGSGNESLKFERTGLGMTISKQLVELMNGQIWADSPSGISANKKFPGSKFSFTVEVHSNEKLKKKFDYSHINKLLQISVLILTKVKDEDDTVHHLLDSLGISYNYRTYEENSIDSAILHIEQKNDLYQLIIIMDKPGKDGFSMAQQLKESRLSEKFPIIIISSNHKAGNYVRSKSLGADYYLIQPFESNEIYKIIKENFPSFKDSAIAAGKVTKIRSKIEILMADDNIINQRVTQSIFKHLGFEIDIVSNGLEAVEIVSKKSYDIIFMDVLMPDMDGFTATKIIRQNGIKAIVVAISGFSDSDIMAEATQAGVNDFISKPLKVETIKKILIKWFSENI